MERGLLGGARQARLPFRSPCPRTMTADPKRPRRALGTAPETGMVKRSDSAFLRWRDAWRVSIVLISMRLLGPGLVAGFAKKIFWPTWRKSSPRPRPFRNMPLRQCSRPSLLPRAARWRLLLRPLGLPRSRLLVLMKKW